MSKLKQLALEYLDLWRQLLSLFDDPLIKKELDYLENAYEKLLDNFSWSFLVQVDKCLSSLSKYMWYNREKLITPENASIVSDLLRRIIHVRELLDSLSEIAKEFFTCSPHKCSHIQILTQ